MVSAVVGRNEGMLNSGVMKRHQPKRREIYVLASPRDWESVISTRRETTTRGPVKSQRNAPLTDRNHVTDDAEDSKVIVTLFQRLSSSKK